jgi:two-component system, NarL family, sensor kinase
MDEQEVLWRQFVPITVGALLLLQLLQVPLAWSTARRLDASLSERERPLRRAVEAIDTERRRIARDLHDGVVQDLAAASFALVGATAQARARGHGEEAEAMEGGAQALRRGIRSLRTLLVEIYPPSPHRAGLPAALRDLLDPLAGRGIEVRLDVPDGFDPAALAGTPAGGHVGLLLLQDLARTAGGHLRIDASPGRGSTLHLQLPTR